MMLLKQDFGAVMDPVQVVPEPGEFAGGPPILGRGRNPDDAMHARLKLRFEGPRVMLAEA